MLEQKQAGRVQSSTNESEKCPLVVDLDDTLVRTDLLIESFVRYLLCHPFGCFLLLVRSRFSLPRLKTLLAARMPVAVESLPYNEQVVSLLKSEHSAGRILILATASPMAWAEPIANHLGIFKHVIATTDQVNAKGHKKLQLIVETLGGREFAYAGDSAADIPLFEASRGGRILVGESRAAKDYLKAKHPDFMQIPSKTESAHTGSLFRALRPIHWVKNLLIFVPALTGWGTYAPQLLGNSILAFLSFSAIASFVYIINDLADLPADRGHPTKRNRPLASGSLSIPVAVFLAFFLLLIGIALAATLGLGALSIVGIYLILNAAYSARLAGSIRFITLRCHSTRRIPNATFGTASQLHFCGHCWQHLQATTAFAPEVFCSRALCFLSFLQQSCALRSVPASRHGLQHPSVLPRS